MSNNIALKAAISKGEGPGKRYIVTAIWDWAPVASWDSGVSLGLSLSLSPSASIPLPLFVYVRFFLSPSPLAVCVSL